VKTWTCVADENDCRKMVVSECPEGEECQAGECAVPTPPVDEGGNEQDVVTQVDATLPDVGGTGEVVSPNPDSAAAPDSAASDDVPAGGEDVAIAADTGGTGEPTTKKKSGCQAGNTPHPLSMLLLILLVGVFLPLRRTNRV